MKGRYTKMKKVLSITAGMVFVFAIGLAYADDWPAWNSNNTLDQFAAKHETDIGKGSAAGGYRSDEVGRVDEYNNDEMPTFFRSPKATSSVLQDEYLKEKAEGHKGSAAGGERGKGPDRTKEFSNDDLYSSLFRR
jgi:hypothetical protein